MRYVEPHHYGSDGVMRYYFRIGKGRRTRLLGKPGEPEFMFAYAVAFTGATGRKLPSRLEPPMFELRVKAAEITRALDAADRANGRDFPPQFPKSPRPRRKT